MKFISLFQQKTLYDFNEMTIKGKGRDAYYDSIKFFLICFVILGHVLMEHLNESPVIDGLHYWIYTFHMPLFVYISGFFSRKLDCDYYKKFLIRTFETFLVFQTVCVLLKYISGEVIGWEQVISPQSVFWYLFSLILWRSLLQIIPDRWIVQRRSVVLLIAFVVGLVSGFIPISNEFSIQRTLSFLPFFVLGYYSNQQGWLEFLRKISPKIALTIFLISLILFLVLLHNQMITINRVYMNKPYQFGIYDMVMRLLIWLLAVGNSIAFIRFSKPVAIASTMGTMTLYFYVYHHFFVNLFVKLEERLSLPISLLTCFLEFFLVLVFCCILIKIPFFRYMVNPITSLIKHKKSRCAKDKP